MRKFLLLSCALLVAGLQTVLAQNRQVAGTVTSPEGDPLIGVTVLVKGGTTGTSTDVNGHYTIDAPTQGTLTFSYIGMKSLEVPVQNRTSINVTLEPDAISVDEIVVTGYGVTRKAAFTGAAQVIDSDIVTSQTDANFMKTLQGSVAGLQMFNVNGQHPWGRFDQLRRGTPLRGGRDADLFR